MDARPMRHIGNFVQKAHSGQADSIPPYLLAQLSPEPETPCLSQNKLLGLLGKWDTNTSEMEEIEGQAEQLPLQDRIRAERIGHDQTFEGWISSRTPSKLLIHGNFTGPGIETSALSLFCTGLIKDPQPRDNHVCLVWFCGRHLGRDDDKSDSDWSNPRLHVEDGYSPGTRQSAIKQMIRSLIAQLLSGFDFRPSRLFPPGIHHPSIILRCNSLSHLRLLFRWLVRQLPRRITLSCLVDGIVFYEREDVGDPMRDALGDILELTASDDVRATVKVLVTSPKPTSTVRMGFERGEILSMNSLTPSHVNV